MGTTAGSWIKVFSADPERFWLTFVGQTLVALSQTFILSVPARLAAVWFGPDQVSSACSIGVFGNQVIYIINIWKFYTSLNNIDHDNIIFLFDFSLRYLMNLYIFEFVGNVFSKGSL